MELCSATKLRENPQLILDFYNERRRALADKEPNYAHQVIAALEQFYDVTVITQNVDNLHELAGSTNVWHVHGDLTKVTSSKNIFDPNCIQNYPLTEPIMVGQQAADGSQLRPYVVMMDEFLPPMNLAVRRIQEADIFVIIGSTLSIGAGVLLSGQASAIAQKFIIDPMDHTMKLPAGFHWIQAPATEGINDLLQVLNIAPTR